MRNLHYHLEERLHGQLYNALNEALAKVQTLNGVSGDIAPQETDEFNHAQQTLIAVMIKQIVGNMPKDIKGTVTILNISDEDYAQAVETYEESGHKVARYYRYDDHETPLYFAQLHDGKFILVLSNEDWYTYDLAEIINACQEYIHF